MTKEKEAPKKDGDREKFDRWLDAFMDAIAKARLNETRNKPFKLSKEKKVALSALAWIMDGFAKVFDVPFDPDKERRT